MRGSSFSLVAIVFSLASPRFAHGQPAGADWPYYRHDLQLTGRSPGKGNMHRTPREKWKVYIGGWSGLITVKHREAANGGVRLNAGAYFGEDYLARTGGKWDAPPLVDLAGDGKPVPAPPGKLAKLLPGVKGLQQVIWDFVPGKANTARGRCYSFAGGADRPKLVWETEEEKEVYEMLWAIADMDGDGKPEVAFMTHYRILVYDGQTGKKKSTLRWEIGRNYGQFTLADLESDGKAAAVVVGDGPAHVDVLRYAPGEGKLLWSQRYITDAQVSLPIELMLNLVPACVQDIDGDGKPEVFYNLYNHERDHKWHLLIRDPRTGTIKHNLPGVYLYGVADLGRNTRSLCCLRAPGEAVPEEAEGLLLEFQNGNWQPSWKGENVRWQMMPYRYPINESSIASRGPSPHSVPRVLDMDGDGRNEVFVCRGGHIIEALGVGESGKVEVKCSVFGPEGSRLAVQGGSAQHEILINADAPAGQVRLAHCEGILQAHYLRRDCAPLPSLPMPMVADLDGDGTNEVLVQDSRWQTRVLRLGPNSKELRPAIAIPGGGLWLQRIWPHFPPSRFPIFTADLDGDGKREMLLTDFGPEITATVTCLDFCGCRRWQQALPGTPARGIVWMAAGHFRNPQTRDILVVVQRTWCEGICLDGSSGKILWRVPQLRLKDGTPFGFGPTPGIADLDGDGLDDIIGASWQYLFAVRGKDGTPLATPRNMISDLFPHFVTYGVAVLGDWDDSGQISLFTNTTTNGFGLVTNKLQRKWFANRNGQPNTSSGAMGRVEKNGGWVFGTFAGSTFLTYEMKTGKLLVSEELNGMAPDATAEVTSADIDGDGRDEFLTVAGTKLICVRGDGAPGPRLMWSVSLPAYPSRLTIADADNDGFVDILYTGSDGYVHCLGH
jgi:outer membrane protein assembly factor BamB